MLAYTPETVGGTVVTQARQDRVALNPERSGTAPTIGDQVRAARQTAALSQAQLAQSSGVAQAAISRIERNQTHDPGVLTVAAIARTLGLSLDDLVAGHVPLQRHKRCNLEERLAQVEAILRVRLP